MVFFPTEDECVALANMEALRTDCELSKEAWAAFQIQTGNLGTRVRSMALLQPEVIHAAVASALSPGERHERCAKFQMQCEVTKLLLGPSANAQQITLDQFSVFPRINS